MSALARDVERFDRARPRSTGAAKTGASIANTSGGEPGRADRSLELESPSTWPRGSGGWFIAQDTGGAINGRRIDVYRPPPASAFDSGRRLLSRRIYVI